jgi:hypothetical protein
MSLRRPRGTQLNRPTAGAIVTTGTQAERTESSRLCEPAALPQRRLAYRHRAGSLWSKTTTRPIADNPCADTDGGTLDSGCVDKKSGPRNPVQKINQTSDAQRFLDRRVAMKTSKDGRLSTPMASREGDSVDRARRACS